MTTPTPVPTPQTRAMLVFEENLDSFGHLLQLTLAEVARIETQAARLRGFVAKGPVTKPGVGKATRLLKRVAKTVKSATDRVEIITLWQVVMLVTCVEAYLRDVLAAAASVDDELMNKSEQRAVYADVIGAASLEALAHDLRVRWARGWLRDRGADALDIAPRKNGGGRLPG